MGAELELVARRQGDPDNLDLPTLLSELGADKGQVVGSAALFGHGQDIDVIVEGLHFMDAAVRAGFVYSHEVYSESAFLSLRRGGVNLLLCKPERYATFAAGHAACKVLVAEGLLTYEMKAARVALHENIHDLF